MNLNKKIFYLLIVIAVAYIGFFLYQNFSKYYKAKNVATTFLNEITQGNYDYAYNSHYLSTINPTIEDKNRWANKLEKLKIEGFYVTGYINLKIELDDAWVTGSLTLKVNENGKKVEYPMYMNFDTYRSHYYVSELHHLNESESLKNWVTNVQGK